MDRDLLRHWLALTRVKGVDCAVWKSLLEGFGRDPVALFEAARSGAPIDAPPRVAKGLKGFRDWEWVDAELDRAEGYGVRIVTYASPDYPPLLKEIPDPPVLLYARGAGPALEAPAVAVVGTRRPSHYGRSVAGKLARELAGLGVTIVSGMARGCDSAAHRGALDAGGATVAVVGTGIDTVYPKENGRLYDEICSSGLVLSEYPLSAPPVPRNFPRRNRIISGLSLAVIVVEAPLRSGSLMTARLALDYNRDVFAVPGPVTSAKSTGTNGLIKQGAALVEGVADVAEGLGLVLEPATGDGGRAGAPDDGTPPLGPDELGLWKALGDGPVHIDELARRTGLTAAGVSNLLLGMELKGRVEQLPGKLFARRVL